jgi:hypothetical protein
MLVKELDKHQQMSFDQPSNGLNGSIKLANCHS